MNIIMLLHVLTLALVFTKVTNLADLSWWQVTAPSLIGLSIAVILGMAYAVRSELNRR